MMPMTTSDDGFRGQIRQFLTTNFYVADGVELTDTMSLLEAGIVDSTGVLEIIAFLETTFHVHVEDDDITPENLDSIERLAEYVRRSNG